MQNMPMYCPLNGKYDDWSEIQFCRFWTNKGPSKMAMKAIKGQKQKNDIYMHISLYHDAQRKK